MTEFGCRLANRPPDAALSPVDVAFADTELRIRLLVNERNDAIAQRDSLLSQVKALEVGQGAREVALIGALRAEERVVRRAVYLAVALFIALCWREGWWIARWIWRML